MAFSRKSYSGPMKNRGTVSRDGKKLANVSKEELDDFRAKFGKDKTLRDLLNADRGSAPKAAAPKTEAPKTEAPKAAAPKKSTIDTMRETAARKYDKDRLAEAKKTAVREEEPAPKINVPEGKTAIERMRKMQENKYANKGMKSGGMVKKGRRGDGCATKGKTKGRYV